MNIVVPLGNLSTVGFVFFESLLEGVGGLAFAFQVFGKVLLDDLSVYQSDRASSKKGLT